MTRITQLQYILVANFLSVLAILSAMLSVRVRNPIYLMVSIMTILIGLIYYQYQVIRIKERNYRR